MKEVSRESYLHELWGHAVRMRQPSEVTFELTYGCNLRCVHCYNPTHRALPQELALSEIQGILDQLAELGVLTVTFSGGELSTRPDLSAILRHTRRRGMICRLLTNATLVTDAFISLLTEVGVEQVCVSLYGATPETYEAMTGVPGSFHSFRDGLSELAASGIPVVARMPVTTLNQHEVAEARRFAEGLGCKFQYCFDIMPTVRGDLRPLAIRLPAERKIMIDRMMLSGVDTYAVTEACPAGNSFIECACGQTRFAITPYGEMNLCTAFPIPAYNLRTGTVKEGWEVLKRTVDEARPTDQYACPTCDVRPYCRQGRSDAWLETGDMSACLPHFKAWAQMERDGHALLDPRRPA